MKNSFYEGLRILSFDRDTIKKVSKEKSLEEIFLSTLFLNYLLVLVVYIIGVAIGGFTVGDKSLNMPVFFGLLMIFPFTYNLIVYLLYGLFALFAELLHAKGGTAHQLLSVGFHTAFVYSIVIFIVALVSSQLGTKYAIIVLSIFFLWYLYSLFVSISEVYDFSLPQTLIVLFLPFLLIGILFMLIGAFLPGQSSSLIKLLFI